MSGPHSLERVVIVGAGFAGFHAARTLSRLARGAVEIVLVNPTDYFLYLPLLPEVTAGILEPRRVAVALTNNCPGIRFLLGTAYGVDRAARRVLYLDARGDHRSLDYDRLVLAVGSVNKLLPIPGVAEHAYGFRSLAEALYLRDHLLREVEIGNATEDPVERAACRTFVVVGAGYTGTEVTANAQLLTKDAVTRCPGPGDQEVRWVLVDIAQRLLPELDLRLSEAAHKVLTKRGVDIRLHTTVEEATSGGVRLSGGEFVPSRTLIWCVGVRPDPLIESLGMTTMRGRLVVDAYLNVPGHSEIYACGDSAAVPDLTRPGEVTAMTAQHAQRQGKRVAHNIAASYGHGERKPYKQHDLGFVVDLGGTRAAANPLGVALTGFPAKVVASGYHLMAIPSNRLRICADWTLEALLSRQVVQLGMVPPSSVRLAATAEAPAPPGAVRRTG
ncbi:NAD(P)/FAD-dependent oxidoreductase [Actinomadura sp. HBU206391]|uniref:NAD(P)/FAD-dependent oxidoreductase n=1 Tax=Actinomadura sp. HBU206391 TaxID=2731692 RepID=UPI00164FAA62|nr:NAD(P)/FAD-dependent oxidoreductase [Actinomadura sp. HBU206391]MBC6459817.1 NAD(P)/FAD-dependent oxidoreductase [Actinomadura sp. HBU206391]